MAASSGRWHSSSSQVLKYAAVWGAMFLLVGCFEEGSEYAAASSTRSRAALMVLVSGWSHRAYVRISDLPESRATGHGASTRLLSSAWSLVLLLHMSKAPSARLLAGSVAHLNCSSVSATPAITVKTGSASLPPHSSDSSSASASGLTGSGLVGNRLSRRLGLGRNLLLWHSRQRPRRPWPLLPATSPTGNPLWSGSTNGPERSSLLIIPIVLLILVWLVVIYRRLKPVGVLRALGNGAAGEAERRTNAAMAQSRRRCFTP